MSSEAVINEQNLNQRTVLKPLSIPALIVLTYGFILCALGGMPAFAQQKQFIFITAPFASSHASTIVQLRNGDLMSAWFGGTAEGDPDVAIWGARRTNGQWTTPVQLVREPGTPCWNPVLFHTKDGRLWLYYKFGTNTTMWTAGRRYSDDDGKTWSPVQHLPAGLLGPIRTKPLVLKNGDVISGSSVESYGSWAAWIERSTDNGETWTESGPITVPLSDLAPGPGVADSEQKPYGIIQPTVIQLGEHWLRMYARSSFQIRKICVADSTDEGVTWTPARPLDVPNPNSGIDVFKLRDGRIVLVYNNTATSRSPLNLAVSKDGEHFHEFYTIEDGPGEFSYPAMIQDKNGDLDITYTWKRKRIRFLQFPLADIPR